MKRRTTFAIDEKLLYWARAVVKAQKRETLVGLVERGLRMILRWTAELSETTRGS